MTALSNQPDGILPRQTIQDLIEEGRIVAHSPIEPGQVQPASLDLRLGARCWRVRASFLPGAGRTVAERIRAVAMHELDLTGAGAVLERGRQGLHRAAVPAGGDQRAGLPRLPQLFRLRGL